MKLSPTGPSRPAAAQQAPQGDREKLRRINTTNPIALRCLREAEVSKGRLQPRWTPPPCPRSPPPEIWRPGEVVERPLHALRPSPARSPRPGSSGWRKPDFSYRPEAPAASRRASKDRQELLRRFVHRLSPRIGRRDNRPGLRGRSLQEASMPANRRVRKCWRSTSESPKGRKRPRWVGSGRRRSGSRRC